MDKRALSETDICTKFITPALRQAGWDVDSQIREEGSFTKGRIIVRGKLVSLDDSTVLRISPFTELGTPVPARKSVV